jgi:hypothetical protein
MANSSPIASCSCPAAVAALSPKMQAKTPMKNRIPMPPVRLRPM